MRPKNIPVFVSYKVELYDDLRKAFKDRKGGYFSISTTIPQQIVAVLTGSTAEQSAQLDEIYEVLDQLTHEPERHDDYFDSNTNCPDLSD